MTGLDWNPDLGSGVNEHTGRRIARARKRRGMNQKALAARANISYSLLTKVEAGHKPASPTLVAAIANALGVGRAELNGQPYRGKSQRTDAVHAAIPEIRRAIACIDITPEPVAPPRSLDELAVERDKARKLLRDAAHVRLGMLLPAAIEELTVHAIETEETRAWRLLSNMLALAFALSRRLGYHDLAQVALEKASTSADKGDDPNLPHVVTLSRALQLFALGSWSTASKLMTHTATRIDQDNEGALHVLTAAHLRGAIAAARAGAASAAWEHHGQAVEAVFQISAQYRKADLYGLQANEGNVHIHGCTVAIEMGDYDRAIGLDEGLVLPSTLSASRRAHYEIDMARTLLWVGKHDKAMQRLVAAEKLAPEMARFHPTARETARQLDEHFRVIPEPLRRIVSRMEL
ncbi:helix-turn-helix domain-containing protein [Streptosporangium sp. NBC_01756]|uniref:helix-turn-helix domain-containing protein n=1 Tax=Streptosporangium sp. NBC_01756 TaxID=2975950 RepID=UPI002DD8234B|nr:helix-turn-helix transcriptional regulator [Streptosporangium sp. NBC_01756]WSC89743.1 helix-turn-helix domain-containing protein [Streptosporangium sp. NBC_01756]